MLRYKQLWTVDLQNRQTLLATRPIFQKLDETIRGHVACSFPAFVLKAEFEERIDGPKRRAATPRRLARDPRRSRLAYRDPDRAGGKSFLVRSTRRPAASLALRAAGVALPPTVRPADNS